LEKPYVSFANHSALLFFLTLESAASAQQDNSTSQHRANNVYLDVVVAPKSGNLLPVFAARFHSPRQQVPQTITSFQALGGGEVPAEVIVLIDAVNAKPETIAL